MVTMFEFSLITESLTCVAASSNQHAPIALLRYCALALFAVLCSLLLCSWDEIEIG